MEPKIGLALSSGGARGFAHVGVIKALVEAEIPIDYISGSSMGALVAGCYAAGLDIKHLSKFAALFQRNRYLDFVVPRMGFVKGEKIVQLMQLLTHGKDIEELQIPTAIVATDLETGKKIVYHSGSAARAIRASISIPGIFVPYAYDNHLLIDGGTVDWVPISEVKKMGADFVIASDVSTKLIKNQVGSVFDVISRSLDIMQNRIKQDHRELADVFILPRVSKFSSTAFTNIEEMINIGESETKKNIKSIRYLIAKWKEILS